MLSIEVAPDGSDLRPSVRHDGPQTGESALLEKVEIFFGNHVRHRRLSLGQIERLNQNVESNIESK
jgi:hypothetical protein